ncbi:hypothetical protein CVD28_25040 [Bacillus sp. M6-12]|uniref:hypothetical protein n=1 Tax=Bacillus sp. M6-12 TaxID=2054166 RepID=UPI000C7899A3|nr:hypothetical protein [Bacillus sp. M6-12]PLS14989.1 hypothetical protein CVD28_25040 [Bacillus sp. M6-12]
MGYGLSISGPMNLVLGPIVASSPQIALLLTEKLAIHHSSRLRIDVPAGNDYFISYLEKSGFLKVSQPPMIKNSEELPPRDKSLFTLAARAFG